MGDPHWTSIAGFVTGLVGAITGVIALVRNVLLNRVKIRVETDYLYRDLDSGILWLNVTNLSSFPVTIQKLEIDDPNTKEFKGVPHSDIPDQQLPHKLESRTSCVLRCPQDMHLGEEKDDYRRVKVSTACGTSFVISRVDIAELADRDGTKRKLRNNIRRALGIETK